MKNSIEQIWKEGFLNDQSMVAPRINDLYNKKSRHLVARIERIFNINLRVIVIMAFAFPITYYFMDFVWQGIASSILLLLTAWYNKQQMIAIKKIDQGADSLTYLKSLNSWIKEVLFRTEKIARLSYPLYFLIAMSIISSAWISKEVPFEANFYVALFAIGILTLLIYYFSDKIYRWDARLMYGSVFKKLEDTIDEMEKLREESC